MVNTFHYSVGCRQVQLHFWSEILEFQNMGLQYCILKHLTYEVITTLTCKSTDTKKIIFWNEHKLFPAQTTNTKGLSGKSHMAWGMIGLLQWQNDPFLQFEIGKHQSCLFQHLLFLVLTL